MTKTLTEQWREGTLPDGYYYIDYDTQQRIFEIEDGCATYQGLPAETYFLNDVCLIKVIATVPSYDEYKELVRKSDKLDKIMSDSVTNQGDCQQIVEDNLNRQIERLREQMKEANAIIEDIRPFIQASMSRQTFTRILNYEDKWGVK